MDSLGYNFHEALFAFSEIFSYAAYIEAIALIFCTVRLIAGKGKAKASTAPVYGRSFIALCAAAFFSFSIFSAVRWHYNNVYEEIIFADTISKRVDRDEHVCYITVNGLDYIVRSTLYDAACEGEAYACTVSTSKAFGRERREIVYLSSLKTAN
jgi:hypothetical protein